MRNDPQWYDVGSQCRKLNHIMGTRPIKERPREGLRRKGFVSRFQHDTDMLLVKQVECDDFGC